MEELNSYTKICGKVIAVKIFNEIRKKKKEGKKNNDSPFFKKTKTKNR